MKELNFDLDWLAASDSEPVERETLASLRITVGPDRIPLTEVDDSIAQTVRQHINVPAYSLARWLVVNWWRLRWEPTRQCQSSDWLRSHCLAAVSGDYAWPPVIFASDGEFINVRLQSEAAPDVSAVRYLRSVALDIPVADFESSIDEFLDRVEARLGLRVPGERDFGELREELREERCDATRAMHCKLQALSGLDPGSASTQWLSAAQGLAATAGAAAAEEILAVVPALPDGLEGAEQVIRAMRTSNASLKLDWADLEDKQPHSRELPWERGSRMAHELRAKLGLFQGPITTPQLENLCEAKFPLPKSPSNTPRSLRGGYRANATNGRTSVLVTNMHEYSQRFYFGRLAGAELRAAEQQHVLPVSDAGTALQKFERSFAQEFLCPWQELDVFTDESGTDDDAIADAATHYGVSEMVILTTLVNKGKLRRNRLPVA